LPFPGLGSADAVAVDSAGNVYVTESDSHKFAEDNHPRVWKLAAGAAAPTRLPFPDLKVPNSISADAAGNLYITDGYRNRVWKLAAGANDPTLLPFTGIDNVRGVAADNAGAVYVVDGRNDRVLKLDAGASSPTVLSVPGLEDADAVAVDADGTVYLTDFHNQCTQSSGSCDYLVENNRGGDGWVMKLTPGSDPITLPFNGLGRVWSISVAANGDVYVIDSAKRLLKLSAHSAGEGRR